MHGADAVAPEVGLGVAEVRITAWCLVGAGVRGVPIMKDAKNKMHKYAVMCAGSQDRDSRRGRRRQRGAERTHCTE